MPEQETWVSVDLAAKQPGIAKDTADGSIDARGLPAHRIGRPWRFKLGTIDEWGRASRADEPPIISRSGGDGEG